MVSSLNMKLFEKIIHKILLMSKKGLYMTKIHKLLYFLEFNYLERNEEELLKERFLKNHFGPTSVNLKKNLNILIEKGLITQEEDDKGRDIYFSIQEKSYNFNEKIKKELKYLEENYLNLTVKEISDLSHKDNPYLVTDDLKEINKHSVFYRTKKFSVNKV